MSVRNLWPLLRQTVTEFNNDNAFRLGAALAFYTALSLSPLLLLVIALAGLVFGSDGGVREEVNRQLQDNLGPAQAKTVSDMLENSSSKTQGWVSTVIGLVTLLVGATGVFAQLQDSLNTVWAVKGQQTSGGFWRAVKDRLLSFSMVAGMAFLVLVSMLLSVALNAMTGWFAQLWPGAVQVLGAGNLVLSVLLTFAMFAMIFKVLPHVKIKWSDVWVGAGLTTVLFIIGKYLIGLYLGLAAPESTFGAAGSFVLLLLWIYYSSLILLFGAEFTQVYATREGSATQTVQVDGGKAQPSPGLSQPEPAMGHA
jgi:membrane protein